MPGAPDNQFPVYIPQSIRCKQTLFCCLLGRLITWVCDTHREDGWELRLGEGYVADSIDKPGEDSPHLKSGGHFKRLALDLMLDVEGEWITNGNHPVWQEIGRHWESMHPLCRWGGRWGDGNHISFEDGGVA